MALPAPVGGQSTRTYTARMREFGWLSALAWLCVVACSSSVEPSRVDETVSNGVGGGGTGSGAGGTQPVQDAGTDAEAEPGTGGSAGGGGDGGAGQPDAGPVDAGPVCVDGEPCSDNPGQPCLTGHVSCEGGVESCVDATPAPDGLTCDDGLCAAGQCLGGVTVSTGINLSTQALTEGRSCAEAPSYSVVALEAREVTLAEGPEDDCLAPGDEVLLLTLQGTPSAIENVGVWELLTVESTAGNKVGFTHDKTRFYGAAAGSDAGVGTGAGDVKVALVRVPRFGSLTVSEGTTLTAAPFNGTLGGILALRAGSLTVDGTLDARTLGYRDGRWSKDGAGCNNSVTTEAGESISGPGTQTTQRNVGGAGGLGAGSGSFNANTPINSTPGHARAGETGFNGGARTLGEPGAAYGAADGSLLTLGSSPGGNVTCDTGAGPVLQASGGRAGGAVLLVVGSLTVSPTGVITATPPDASRDVAYAGGFILVKTAGSVTLGDERVSAQGSVGRSGSPPTAGLSNRASEGYIVVQTAGAVTGTTDPVAQIVVP